MSCGCCLQRKQERAKKRALKVDLAGLMQQQEQEAELRPEDSNEVGEANSLNSSEVWRFRALYALH
jgi:hypothetical protein